MQIKYHILGDELLGHSILEPVYKTFTRLINIEEGIANGIVRHGSPLFHVQIGDETHPPSAKQIDDAAEAAKGVNARSEFITPYNYKIKVLESYSLKNIDRYTQMYLDEISASTGLPQFILTGSGEGTNKSTADKLIKLIPSAFEPHQLQLKLTVEQQLLKPLFELNGMGEFPTIEWNEMLPEEGKDIGKKVKI